MLQLETFPVGPLGCNCTLLWSQESGRGVVVDPGGDGPKIRRRVEQLGIQVQALLHTHAHFDHVGATRELQDLWQCEAFLHPGDAYLVEHLDMQTGLFGMAPVPRPQTTPQDHGDTRQGLRTLHTPGHTPGSCCFQGEFTGGRVVMAGDTLFARGVGRTDLWGGSWEQLEESILKHLYPLDRGTLVIPGHGPLTTIGEEQDENPFVRK
ncbi:MAG: MBL fold metallo-hydrolase [Acidobacteria bacterium]|nr:MBL fold metallo-hydrolase [Acidobacteriota bacterium]